MKYPRIFIASLLELKQECSELVDLWEILNTYKVIG